ncbi:hypothetical protein BJ878DRAFT_514522 [Calycina marina]|uniref:Alcohol dehydrogenase-like N-terminal domain-containing protein n=1 Tax=Calycina marina TaxID=1763456 RepID=A0A9P8CD41_9HELO|nr:hypothetical protein BJ878DRAFT_514522 [Calycina marina]
MGILVVNNLGIEGSGIITDVGSGVNDFRIGHRVIFFAANVNCLATEIRLPSLLCHKTHNSLSFEESATIPAVFITVVQAIIEMDQLDSGESVLI